MVVCDATQDVTPLLEGRAKQLKLITLNIIFNAVACSSQVSLSWLIVGERDMKLSYIWACVSSMQHKSYLNPTPPLPNRFRVFNFQLVPVSYQPKKNNAIAAQYLRAFMSAHSNTIIPSLQILGLQSQFWGQMFQTQKVNICRNRPQVRA